MLSAADIVHQGGIPVTTPARTLLDLSELISESALERAVERAEALRLIDFRALRAMLAAKPTRAGSSVLARVVDRYQIDASVTRSELEDLFLDLCAAHGLPRPLVNARVCAHEVDFLWRDERVIIETDGRSTHATRAAFERDRARDAQLVVAGYRVVRFTYRQVKRAPNDVADVVRSLLDRAGAQPPERSISSIL